MKVGVLTYHNAYSYGAQLQAYALQEVVRSLGHEVKIVDYKGEGFEKPAWGDFRRAVTPSRLVCVLNRRKMKQALAEFAPYQDRTRPYASTDELTQSPPGFDAYICGSDQIWQPKKLVDGRIVRDEFFLSFAEPSARRIAYAPSFGTIPSAEYMTAVVPHLRRFSALSVREKSMVDLIRQYAELDVPTVCDPTILLGREGFDRLLEKDGTGMLQRQGGGVFYFPLSYDLPRDRNVASALKKRFGRLAIVSRPLRQVFLGANAIPTPVGWIRMIKDADFALTNSFHGTAFSILFNKPFLTLSWKDRTKNGRVRNLLEDLGLGARFCDSADVSEILRAADQPIDWVEINRRMSVLRTQSRGFLAKALG